MKLKGKVAIITGSGQGLGREYAKGFAKEGAKVVIAEINEESAGKVLEEISAMGGEAIVVKTDVSKEEDTLAMVARTIEKFGKVDILVNNAAIYYGIECKPIECIEVKDWDRSFNVNVKGVWLCIKAVLPQMKKQGSGKIINISSGTWLMGIPNLLSYTSSKAAVLGMTRCVAKEVGEFDIKVNCITPGFTMTDASKTMKGLPPGVFEMISATTALSRNEEPEDLVGPAIFLASSDSDFISGQNIVVDGGWALY